MSEEHSTMVGVFDLPEFHHERFSPESKEKLLCLEEVQNKEEKFKSIEVYVKKFIKDNIDKKWSSIFIKNKSYLSTSIVLDRNNESRDLIENYIKELDYIKTVVLKDKDFLFLLDYLKLNNNKSKLLSFIYHKTLMDFNIFCKFYFNSKSNVLITDFNRQAIEFIKQTFILNKSYIEWFSFIKNSIMLNIRNMFLNIEHDSNDTIVKIGTKENIFCSVIFNYMFDSNVNISSAVVSKNTEFYKTLNNIFNNKSCFGYKETYSHPPFKYYYFKYCTYNIYSNIFNTYNVYRTKNEDFIIAKI